MLVLALQFTPADFEATEELVALITDLEPKPRRDVELLLFYRKDVPELNVRRLANTALTRFPRTLITEAWDFAEGWPAGPNAMWASLMRQLFQMSRTFVINADGALTFEPDCIPVSANWISELSEAWDAARRKQIEVIGHMHPNARNPTHINGNAIFCVDFWKRHEEVTGCHAMMPWDTVHAPLILKVGADTPLILQHYRMDEFGLKDWKALRRSGVSLFHGIKSGQGRVIARQQLLGRKR